MRKASNSGSPLNFPFLAVLVWAGGLEAGAGPGSARTGAFLTGSVSTEGPLHSTEAGRIERKETGQTLALGLDLERGPHLLELRLGTFIHPQIEYYSSFDRVASLAYGHYLGLPYLRGCAGIGLYQDFKTPGIPISLRLDWRYAGLEAYWVRKDFTAIGLTATLRTGNLL